jgi:hypothetical protein
VLVRRRIQTPSDAKVLSVVQPEEEVVLGASPPARLIVKNPALTVGNPARFARHDDFRRFRS